MKRFLKYVIAPFLGLLLLFFIGIEIYFNYYFDHEQLRLEALKLISSKVEGNVQLGDIDITVYDRFTHASIKVSNLAVEDQTDTLLIVGEAIADVLLTDALSGNFLIENLRVSRSFFMSHVHLDTTRSELKIIKGDGGGKSKFNITSHDITVTDSRLRIINELKDQDTKISIDQAEITLDANEEVVTLSGDVTGALDSISGAGSSIISNRKISARNARVEIHRHRGAINFSTDFFNLSHATFVLQGSITPTDSGNYVDMRLSGKDTGLDEVISFIPDKLGEHLFQVNENASINLIIEKKGMSNKWTRPRTDITFSVRDAALKRSDFPDLLKGIDIAGKYTNGSERSSRTSRVEIATAKAHLRDSYFISHFTIVNFDDPYLHSSIQADMDVRDLHKFISLSKDIKSIEGNIKIDMNLDGKVSQLQGTDLLEDQYKGTITLNDINMVVGAKSDSINHLNGLVSLNNDLIQLEDLNGVYNETKFRLSGEINEYAGVILDSESAILDCYLKCQVDNYTIDASGGSGRFEMPGIPSYVNAGIDLSVDNLQWGRYTLKDLNGSMVYYQNAIEIDRLSTSLGGGQIESEGKLDLGKRRLAGELDVKARYDELDLAYFMADSTVEQKGNGNDLIINLDLIANELVYKKDRYRLKRLTGRIANDTYNISKLAANNDLMYVDNVGPLEIKPKDKQVRGSLLVDIPVIHVDDYLNPSQPSVANTDEIPYLDWWENSDLVVRIKTDSMTYGNNVALKTRATATARDGLTSLIFQTNAYEGSLSGDLVSSFKDSIWHGHIQMDAADIHLKTFLTENNNFDQKLLNDEHVDGEIDFQTSVNLSYDLKNKEWLPTSGWADIAKMEMGLIDFDPITHALKFIKYEYIDTLDVVANEVKFYFIDQEIVVPPVMLKTSESNFLFFGYHDKDDNLELDLHLSISDLVFKSRKKKYSDFNNAEMNHLGGLDFRMTLFGTPDSLDSKHIRKKIFEGKRTAIIKREQDLRNQILALKEKSSS